MWSFHNQIGKTKIKTFIKNLPNIMFIDYTDNEKKEFLSQTQTYFLPGYTGHCPTLKFQIGKCYGTSTKEIIQTLRRNGVIRNSSKNSYNNSYPEKSVELRKTDLSQRKYILGYTGYIPGMYQHYGQSFHQIAEKCETKRKPRSVSCEKKLGSSKVCRDIHLRR